MRGWGPRKLRATSDFLAIQCHKLSIEERVKIQTVQSNELLMRATAKLSGAEKAG